MNNNEKNILKDMSNSIDKKMNFMEIAYNIDYSKYKKESKKLVIFKKQALALSLSIILVVALVAFLMSPPNPSVNIPKNPTLINSAYNGFIKETFESNIGDGPLIENMGPIPAPPVIDGYFNIEMDTNTPEIGDNPTGKPDEEFNYPLYIEMRSFNYIYEVEYACEDSKLEYVAAYIKKDLAVKISTECKEIMDATSAGPIDLVNGSIVEWFYSVDYYDAEKIFWCQYTASNQIFAEINGYICVGVYQPQQRTIIREIFSNTSVNIVDNIYTKLLFKNINNMYLKPIIDKAENEVVWYASNNLIDETNTSFLFEHCYGAKFDCIIDREANTIRLETYAVQNDDELAKLYSKILKNYHISTNSIIVENEDPNLQFGETTYITYKYKEFVEIIQNLSKLK